MKIYFDNAATTRVFDQSSQAVAKAMTEEYFNPSSPYADALNVEKKIDSARDTIKKNLNLKGDIIFTAGGSESNNLAIKGALSKMRKSKIITSEIEHPSVRKTCEQAAKDLGFPIAVLPVDKKGHVIKEALHNACKDTESALVSVMHVNNETGTVQSIGELAKIAKNSVKNCVFHTDGVQGYMKVSTVDFENVDMYSISAHKIHGPKGMGALYIKDKNLISAVTTGGGQEKNLRAGTYNTPGIAAFAKSVEILSETHEEYIKTMESIKKIIIDEFNGSDIDYIVCGDKIQNSAPHILNVAFRGIMGEVLLSAIDNEGLIANTGSACSSKKTVVSSVLRSMNIDKDYIQGAIRLSFGAFNTTEQAVQAAQIIINNVKRLRRFKRT